MIADISNLGAATAASERQAAAAKAPRSVSVWLVDDDESLRELLKELLESNTDLRCPEDFGSPSALLEALRSLPVPDVILLDINLGAANGLDAIAPIRRLAPQTRILMLTTFHDSQSEARAREAGAVGFMVKSYGLGEIVERIHRAMEQPLPAVARNGSSATYQKRKEVKCALDHEEATRAGQFKGRGFLQGLRALLLGQTQTAADC